MGLFDIFSNDTAEKAAALRKAGLQQGYDELSGFYDQGRGAITTNYDAAAKPFQTLFDQSQPGAQAYGDASGANGAEGTARARANFTGGPQFGFQLDTGLQAIDRGAASRGLVTSGNTLMGEQKYGNDLANSSWKDYLSGLQPYLGQGTSAASGLAGVRTGEGNALNTSYMGQGAAANANRTGQGNADASAELNNYNVSQNMWKGIGEAAKLAAAFV